MRRGARRDALDALQRAAALADERRLGDDLGFSARAHVRRALRWAGARVPAPGRDLVGERVHRLRVAWLRAAGCVDDGAPEVRDADGAASRFHDTVAAMPARTISEPLSRKTKLGWLFGLGAAGAAAVVVVQALNRPAPPVGEGPAMAPEVEAGFVDALTDWVVGLDAWTRLRFSGALDGAVRDAADALAARRARLLTPEVVTFFGAEASERLSAALDQAEKTSLGRHWEAEEEDFADDVRLLNRSLGEAGRGYFFDPYAVLYQDGRPETALFLFRVAARRTWLVAGDQRIDALHLRRLDRLNIVQHLLGYTSKRMDVAALLLDQLEKEVVTRIGPSLEPGRAMPLELGRNAEAHEAPWVGEVGRAAGTVIRATFEAEMAGDEPGLAEFGKLLAERAALVDAWNGELAGKGVTFSAFDTFALSDATYDEVARVVGNAAKEALQRVQAGLETDLQRARFARILARHARPVEQHEVQHRIDYGLGDGFKAPEALLEQLDIPVQSALAQHEDVVRAALELSAYTSEIARDPHYASVALILLSEHLLQGGGGAEGHVAVMVLDGLRTELDIAIRRPLGTMAPVPADQAAEAWLALAHVPGENIARAAARLWARWFGRELAPLTPATESP